MNRILLIDWKPTRATPPALRRGPRKSDTERMTPISAHVRYFRVAQSGKTDFLTITASQCQAEEKFKNDKLSVLLTGREKRGVCFLSTRALWKENKTLLYAEPQSGDENSSQHFDLLGRDLITRRCAAQGVDWMCR